MKLLYLSNSSTIDLRFTVGAATYYCKSRFNFADLFFFSEIQTYGTLYFLSFPFLFHALFPIPFHPAPSRPRSRPPHPTRSPLSTPNPTRPSTATFPSLPEPPLRRTRAAERKRTRFVPLYLPPFIPSYRLAVLGDRGPATANSRLLSGWGLGAVFGG